jgi:FkbM family methyltransferase
MIPAWIKVNSLYPRARVSMLSILSRPRFYSPMSAFAMCRSQGSRSSGVDSVRMVRHEGSCVIWETPLGEIATMATECAEHIAFLVAEFKRDVYLSEQVTVSQDAVVLDVGANIGLFTRQALRNGAKRVISIEPVPGNREALRYNVAPDIASGRVSVVASGTWDVRGTLPFLVDAKRPGRSSCMVENSSDEVFSLSVDVAPIDDIVEELSLPRVDFIKMDIEGAELRALKGAAKVIRRDRPRMAIAVEHTDDILKNAQQVRDLVRSIEPQYRCFPGPYLITQNLRLAPEVLYFR